MTAVESVALPAHATPLTLTRRLRNVVRLQFANPWPMLILPWLIMMGIFGINYAIWQIISSAAGGRGQLEPEAFENNGGMVFIFIYMMVVAVQAMNLTFRFALGMSVTRRDYYLGSSVFFVMLSFIYGVGIALLAGLERITGGWGLGAAFFAPTFLQAVPLWQVGYIFVVLLLFFFFVGAAVATMHVRWRANGLVAFFAGLALLLVGLAWLATVTKSWGRVGAFFTENTVAGIVSWTLLASAAFGVVGHLLLRRATPRG